MLKRLTLIIIFLPVTLHLTSVRCQAQLKSTTDTWDKISTYFSPPDVYEGNYGKYRSPLLFSNGDSVRSKAEWNERRKEI